MPRSGACLAGYGMLQPRVTPVAARGPRCLALSARLFRDRAASIRMRSPYRTSIKTCSARDPSPARASTIRRSSKRRSPAASARTAAQSRFVRGHLRQMRAGLRRRGRRGVSVALRRGRRASTSLDARRLAIASLDLRRALRGAFGAPVGRWKMLDNLRRSLLAPASFRRLRAGLGGTPPACLERLSSRHHRAARAHPVDPSPRAAAAGQRERRLLRRAVRGPQASLCAHLAATDFLRRSGVADDRRDRAYALPYEHLAAQFAAMDARGTVEAPRFAHCARFLSPHGRRPRVVSRRDRAAPCGRASTSLDSRAIFADVVLRADRRTLRERARARAAAPSP